MTKRDLQAVLLCFYSNDLPLHIFIPSNSVERHMLTDGTTLHTTRKSVVQIQRTPQLFQCGATLITCLLIL